MNSAEYARWSLERKLILDKLDQIERAEREILASVGCQVDPAGVYAVLAGEQAPPWPTRTTKRDRTRALHSMHTLLWVAEARRYLALGRENARLAAHAALMVGLFANNTGVEVALGRNARQRARAGGAARGAQIAQEARRNDATIARYYRRWQQSDELQDQFRSGAAYVKAQTGLPLRTIQRRIERMRSHKPRQ